MLHLIRKYVSLNDVYSALEQVLSSPRSWANNLETNNNYHLNLNQKQIKQHIKYYKNLIQLRPYNLVYLW